MTAAIKPTMPRKLVVSRAWAIKCPRCGRTVKGVQVATGSMFIRCNEKQRANLPGFPRTAQREAAGLPGFPLSERCGGRLYALGTGHGLCLAVEISDEEHAYLAGAPRDPLEVCEYLGLLSRGTWIREGQAHYPRAGSS